MRRAKIRPSINLAASRPRRSAPTHGAAAVAGGDRSLKSPAKSPAKSSDRSLRSPVKTATPSLKSPAKTAPSPVKPQSTAVGSQRASRSSSTADLSPGGLLRRQTSTSKQSPISASSVIRNISREIAQSEKTNDEQVSVIAMKEARSKF